MPYVPSVEIEYIATPLHVEDNGGEEVTLDVVGVPVVTDLLVFVFDGTTEHPCFSGVAGQGRVVRTADATTITFVVPPLPKGGPYDVRIYDADLVLQETVSAALYAVNRVWRSRVFAMRQSMPPLLHAGPRRLDDADPLA